MFKLPQRPKPEGHKVYGSLAYAPYYLEAYRNTERLTKNKYQVAVANHQPLVLDLEMLASASEVYQISPDPKDYIIIPIPIVTVGIPNRNLQAFPLEEVTLFDHNQGQLVYQTFKNKPLFINHEHDVVPNSKGIHVDASMEYVPKYGIWKICVVTMWDRTKDEALVRQMLKNDSNPFSMGAMSSAFLCSICGKMVFPDKPDKNCAHQQKSTAGTMFGKDQRLAYQLITGSCFFETSYIPVEKGQFPADPTAYSPDVFS